MQISFPKEDDNEKRVSILPETVMRYCSTGVEIAIESGLGSSLNISDELYSEAGALVLSYDELYESDNVVFRLHKPTHRDISKLKGGTIHLSFLDPYNDKELILQLAEANVTAMSVEMIPRITRAQKMDVLSSQANLAGYSAVIVAANIIGKALPMMMTASGTIKPCKVFVIGVGIAGLQAIATAKRLGARVEAFDTRPVVEEQVHSLGAKFVKIELGDTGETKDGHALVLSAEQVELQKKGMTKSCSQADIVITTAQLFSRPAPQIITLEMIELMKPGSVIVDMAVTSGGNVEGSVADEIIYVNNVKIVGLANLPGEVAESASLMYSNNLFNFFEQFWDK